MFEADGVDSGAICKRGFTHLQFAEKPEAPEAERHLGVEGLLFSRSGKIEEHSLMSAGIGDSILGSGVCRESTTGCAQAVIEASDVG
ncbi:hypothetical protein HZH68_001740 [Vespula germanica]|uniref:Uncharacterized protein n=1 Tax=Vespula germanica TaxID=30212 RepID=A0A834U783_VESGE|nr:hypothetical protein HZH68_001740 [Vespula germanica]